MTSKRNAFAEDIVAFLNSRPSRYPKYVDYAGSIENDTVGNLLECEVSVTDRIHDQIECHVRIIEQISQIKCWIDDIGTNEMFESCIRHLVIAEQKMRNGIIGETYRVLGIWFQLEEDYPEKASDHDEL